MRLAANIRLTWNPRVAARTVDEQAFVLLNSRLLALNEVGSFVWDRFRAGATLDDAVSAVQNEFEVDVDTAGRDVRHLVEELLAKDLLVTKGATRSDVPSPR